MSRNHLFILLPYRVCRLLLTLVAITFAVALSFAPSAANSGGLGDGLSDQERTEFHNRIATSETIDVGYRGIIIVDSTRPVAYFGMYRFSQMTQPGWTLFENVIDWAISHQSHATARIWFVTYNGTLDSTDYREEDPIAAYDYLIDSMGFDQGNIHVASQQSFETDNFTGFDLVLYVGRINRSTANVISQNIPYITTSYWQSGDLGIATGDRIMHETRDFVFIQDIAHEITSSFGLGQLMFEYSMWMDAAFPSGNGLPLVTADEEVYYSPAWVRIERNPEGVLPGDSRTLSIYQESLPSWFAMGGYDFLLTYDASALTVAAVAPGSLLDSCQWEYFTYRTGTEADCGGSACSDGRLRIVAVADLSGVSGSPTCYASEPGSLAEIEFQVASDTSLWCSFLPVDFIWYDCGDNAVSSVLGDTLFISRDVFSASGSIITQDTSLPTLFGAPDECLTGGAVPAIRRINYRNGGLFVLGCPHFDQRGDVNLNAIAYEIADAVLFAGFFVYGLDVFQIDQDRQVEATEINNDGIPLTLDDYVYLWRVIIGDTIPFPTPPMTGDTVFFVQDTLSKTVRLTYTGSIRAIYLVFEGDLMPWGISDSTRPFDGQFTRVLVDDFLSQDSTLFEQDSLLFYTGEGSLVAAFAAYDGLTPLPTAIEEGTNSCCVSRGNVDGDSEGLVNIIDVLHLVSYVIWNEFAPPCSSEADIDGDLWINLIDIVYLADYLFLNGPPPPDCPQ